MESTLLDLVRGVCVSEGIRSNTDLLSPARGVCDADEGVDVRNSSSSGANKWRASSVSPFDEDRSSRESSECLLPRLSKFFGEY
jgi:hypothetical protein